MYDKSKFLDLFNPRSLMSDTPAEVAQKQLDELHIAVANEQI